MERHCHRLLIPLIGVIAGALGATGAVWVLVLTALPAVLAGSSTRRAWMAAVVLAAITVVSSRPWSTVPDDGPMFCAGSYSSGLLTGDCTRAGSPPMRLRVRILPVPAFADGRRLSVTGRFRGPASPTSPGQPDARSIARSGGYDGVLLDIEQVRFLGADRPTLRRRFLQRHRRIFAGLDRSGILTSMTTGDRSGMSSQVREQFRDAGLSHLLAISGFHVGIVGIAVFGILGGVLGRTPLLPSLAVQVRAISTLVAVCVYAAITGGAPSTIRAASMATLLLGRRMFGRTGSHPMRALFAAAIAFGVLRPGAVLGPGLLMSFAAVYGLIADAEGARSATLTAVLFTAPVSVAFFGTLTPVALLSNILAMPLAALVVTGTALAHVTGPLSPLLASGADLATQGLQAVAEFFSYPPVLPVEAWRAIPLTLALLAARIPGTRAGRRTVAVILTAVALIPTGFLRQRPLELTFLDVGQGDATLIEMPSGYRLLVDTGPPSSVYTVRSAVGRRGVDKVVITHPHQDHDGGLPALLSGGFVDSVAASSPEQYTMGVAAKAGEIWVPDPEVRVLVLGPAGASTAVNEASVILMVVHGSVRFLLTGDAERRGEEALVRVWGDLLAAEVVKVPHHGSATSSNPFFVDRAAGGGYAVVSVGRDNRFGLPDAEPLDRWRDRGQLVLSTAGSGSILCSSSGRTVHCKPFAQSR